MNYEGKTKYHDKFGQQHVVSNTCRKCNKRPMGPQYQLCVDHVAEHGDQWKERRKQILIDLGLYQDGESLSQIIGRLKVRGSTKEGRFSLAQMLKASRDFLTERSDSNGQRT